MKIINLTPHPIQITDASGVILTTFPKPTGLIPRLSQKTVVAGEIDGIPITSTEFGETENLPDHKEGVFYIVSRMIMAANPNRNDLLVPNEMMRDEKGRIVGCKSLARN